MKVNGKKIKIYQLDNINTIIQRIASDKKTLSKYLYFPEEIPTKNTENIIVEDIVQIINNYSDDITFSDLYTEIKDKLEQNNLSLETDILPLFLLLNKTLSETDDDSMLGSLLLAIQQELDNLKIKVDISDLYKKQENFIIELENNKNKLKKLVKTQNELFEQFENIQEGINFTQFYLEKSSMDLELNFENIGIMEIFNQLQLNKNVPFATINNFYKIYKQSIPSPDWNLSLDNTIIIKVLNKNAINPNYDDYTNAFIILDKQENNDKIIIGITLNITGQNISKEDYINRILSIFNTDIKIIKEKENKVNGVFYLPLQKMNKYIFSDLVMNNPLFSSMMVIDEHTKASKSKDSVYIHFYNESIGELTASITEKLANKNDADIRKKDKKIFPENKNYIRIKVTKAQNQQAIILFQNIISKLFAIYNNLTNEIIQYYKKFIPTFSEHYGQIKKTKEKEEITSKKLKLKDIVPELFISGYPKRCPKQPTIIEDDEVEDAIKDGYQVMTFPKPNNNFNLEPKNYICEYKTHVYPGLRDNPLENKEQIPFLPCCYEKDQTEKKGSYYRQYFFDEEPETKKNIQQDSYITNKILPNNGSGIIPKNLENLFNLIENNDNIYFERKGVHRTKNSLLECIIKATQYTELKKIENIETFLNNFKENLATPQLASLCKQELYDKNIDEIIDMIKDNNQYFDPQYFIPLLEHFFNCNIFIFNRKFNDAILKLPRYQQTYYKFQNQNNSIIILEHMGSSSDYATYPQCELITKINTQEKTNQFLYNYNSKLNQQIKTMFNQLKETYKLNQKIPDTILPITNFTIQEQTFDSYGKTRILNIIYKKYNITLFTNPIPPLPIIENNEPTIHKIKYSILTKILPIIQCIPSGQIVQNNITKEITGIIGNVSVSIPIEDNDIISNLPILTRSLSYSIETLSQLDIYNQYKKLSRYIIEYTYWLYSKYLEEINNDNVESLTNILNFKKKYIQIIPNFKYAQTNKKFSMKSTLMKNNKLIITSEEILKRIIYVLREFSIRHSYELLNYKNKQNMEGYYIDINDFDKYSSQIILQGENSIQKWIYEQKNKYIITNKILTNELKPYFFQNNIIEKHKLFLAQNTDSIQKALYISQQWYENDFNPSQNIPNDITNLNLQFILYSYANQNDIQKYIVRGKKIDYNIKIIAYKITTITQDSEESDKITEIKNKFTVLLEL
jgi:hypothetical protein